jgi:hypothetical protein
MTYNQPETCHRKGCGNPARGQISRHPLVDDEFCGDHAAENAALRAGGSGELANRRGPNFGIKERAEA